MTEAIKWLILSGAIVTCTVSRRWGLAVFVFLIPLMQWLPDIPVSGLNALNLMLLPLFIRALFAGKAKGKDPDPVFVLLLIFGFLFLISYIKTVTATTLPARFYRRDGLFSAMLTTKEVIVDVMIYFCARRLTRDPEDMLNAFKFGIAGYLFEALTAFREFFGSAYRATAHLGQPNKLGAFLAGYLMIPYGFLLTSSGRLRFWSAAGVAMTVMGLLGAVSRGSLLAAGAGMIALGLFRRSKWVVVVLLVAVTSPLWLPEKFMDRFASTVDHEAQGLEFDTEHEGRFMLWEAGFKMIAANPLGVGVEQFPWHLREFGYEGNYIKSSHNIYVQLAAEQGIAAALTHIGVFIALAIMAFRLASRGRTTIVRSYGTAMLGVVIAFAAGTNFGDGFYETNLSGFFWVLAAMTVNIRNGMGFGAPTDPVPEQP